MSLILWTFSPHTIAYWLWSLVRQTKCQNSASKLSVLYYIFINSLHKVHEAQSARTARAGLPDNGQPGRMKNGRNHAGPGSLARESWRAPEDKGRSRCKAPQSLPSIRGPPAQEVGKENLGGRRSEALVVVVLRFINFSQRQCQSHGARYLNSKTRAQRERRCRRPRCLRFPNVFLSHSCRAAAAAAARPTPFLGRPRPRDQRRLSQ